MSDIKLFRLGSNGIAELAAQHAKLEKDLQSLVEQHMEVLLGLRFLATEFTTSNGGRIDSLGLDENGCPVIIEYKRHSNENVINQGLFYYDWLLDHKAEFQLLVMKMLGNQVAENIEWSGARLICIASDFNKYDEHAIKQIDKNIELMRYKYFGDDLMMLELVNSQTIRIAKSSLKTGAESSASSNQGHQAMLAKSSKELLNLYEAICDFCESLGDDAQRKELKLYTAFTRIKNFVCFHVLPQKKDERIVMYLKVDPSTVDLQAGFSSDVREKGHWGTGDLELLIRTPADIEKAKPLIQRSFENN